MGKYNKPTFDNLGEAKRQRILTMAMREFATKGFSGANINVIAARADISVGSIYRYFASKDDLFLTVVEHGLQILDKLMWEIIADEGDLFWKIERIVRMTLAFSKANPELFQMYMDGTTEAVSGLSIDFSNRLETLKAQYFQSLLSTARERGLVSPDTDELVAAFCIDNLLMMMHLSYTSSFFKQRMLMYVGREGLDDDERIVKGYMQFIRRALGPEPQTAQTSGA